MVVTLPEPDCVVCAYVNGAIIFSSCVADQPVCTSDADCLTVNGAGRCIEGQCVAQPTCTVDNDCPAGFTCQLDECPLLSPCAPDTDCPQPPPCVGSCVPAPIDCRDSLTCPAGMECRVYCTGACAPGSECNTDPCMGVCEPVQTTCASDNDCPAGFVCQLEACPMLSPCAPGSECPPQPPCDAVCVPAPQKCWSDADCPSGTVCQFSQDEECPYMCNGDSPCPPCPANGGICEPLQTGCQGDIDCPSGMVCETSCLPCDPTGDFCANVCQGVCVPVEPPPVRCASDIDCGDFVAAICWNGQCYSFFDCDMSHNFCDMVPPTCEDGLVPSVVNGCFGPCINPSMCAAPTPCVVSGCAGQICSDHEVYTDCAARPEDSCFATATCEVQADGLCGWTQTDALTACLTAARQ